MASAADSQIVERGVYKACYRMDGCEVLYAITSAGERLRKIVLLRPGVSETRAYLWLNDVLNRVDPPRPPLRLVPDQRGQLSLEDREKLYRDADPVRAMLWRRNRRRNPGRR